MNKVSTSTASKCSLDFKQKLWAVLAAVAMVIALLPVFAVSTAFADDPIHSPGQELGEKHAVSGRVFLDRSGSRSYMEPDDKQGASDGDIGLGGAKVYAQWTDYNNRRQKGALSPVYYSQARPDGTYVIQLPDWTDSFGTVHKWEATLGQTLRIWADNPDSSKYTLAFVEGDSTFGGQGDRYRGTWNGVIGFNLAENYNIAFQERPQFDQMFPAENTWKQSSRKGGGGDVTGQVWYEERQSKGNSEAVPTFSAGFGEVKVPGVKVVGAYVQDEVARRFDQWKKDHKNYKRDEFKAAQREIMKAYEAETGKSAIAETVYDTTDAEGKYHLQFQGLWGNSYSAKGIMNAGTWGELVPEGANASWAKANLRSRHVNTEYMYVAPELPNGVGGSLNNFRDNMYQDGLNWTPNATTGSISNVENVNFALRIEGRDFHIETYDQTTNPAKPGDTAPTKATGFVPNNTYDIVWTDGDGNEVKTCTTQASNLGVVESCDFTVPANLAKDEIYIASIYPGGFDKPVRDRAMAKDSFAAKVTPEYKTTTIDLDGTATVATPNNKENNTTPPADTTYSAAAAGDVPAYLLEGVDQSKVTVGAQAWAKINSDGTISLNPKKGSVTPGSYLIPVKMTYGSGKDAYERIILAPVTVQDANADSDGDGVPDAADKCAGVAGPSANSGCPAWDDGSGTPGTDVTLPKDAKNGALPDSVKCSADNGATCSVEKDGSVKVSVPSAATPGTEITVTVKDGDKTLDTSKVTVIKPADGDGDGVADAADKCAGTPAGAKVDADGCAVVPVVGDFAVKGMVGKAISPVSVKVTNDGKASDLSCSADELTAVGLTVKFDAASSACVISGTPTKSIDKQVDLTVGFKRPDGAKDAGTVKKSGSVFVAKDDDGDGVVDPKDPGNPVAGEDKCPGTPKGAKVDNDGCSVAPSVGKVSDITGQVNKEITPVNVPVDNPGKAKLTACKADGLPAGLTIALNEQKDGCVITGTPSEEAKDKEVTVKVSYEPVDKTDQHAGGDVTGTAKATISAETDGDNDGVADSKDKCAGTPAGAKVDANGCAVKPTVGDPVVISGQKGKEITEVVVVPVENPGMAAVTCSSDSLPAGLSVKYSAEKKACVVSGTPSEEVKDKAVTVSVNYDPQDGDDTSNPAGSIPVNTTATITDPGKDSDGDGLPDASDKCAGTPAGAKVDADGCAVVPVVGDFAVKGMVGKAISPVSVKVTNDGKASDLSCSADELTAVGLTVKFDAASSACVISGTPTKSIDKQVDLTVGFKRPDGAKDAGTVKKSGSVFVAKDDDGDGVVDPKDPGNPVAGEDKCPGTPKGAKVDNDGCSVLPTVGKIDPIVGEKDTPITSVTVPVDNPGKSKLTACKAEGLPAGLTIALNKEGTACVISGTPTEIVNPGRDVNVTVSFEPADKSADHPGGDIQGKTSVTIKDNLTDADRYNPAYLAVTGKPGESVKASQTGDKNVPDTARYVLGDNAPQGASVDAKTGQVTLNIPDTAKNGEEITVPVKVNYADKSADNATVTVKVRTDKDGDGKPDPVDSANPQAGDDLCPGTPAADKDKVDEFGCTLADRWNPSYADVNGQVGKPAVSAAPVFDEVTTKDKDEKTAAPAGTKFALGKDAPAGVSIDAKTGIITWDKPAQGNTEIPVKVTYKDGTTDKVTAKFKIALPGDDDGDGVADDKDKCAGTPQDAKVDKNGCSVAPSLPDAPKITGEKGKAIDPVDVPVKNPGKTKVTACQATGLPAGLTIEWNEGKQACVISGTPTEEVTDGKVTITVDYTPQDKTDQHPGGKASGETTVTITDPAKDGDGDGVADKQDRCANTPKGAAVDKNGCALAPSVPVIPNIEGQKDKPLTPVVVPVDNPGKATITSCKAERLPKGLNIKWDEKRSACVISGTPTEIVTGQKVTISIDYTAPDGGKKPGSTQVETMVTIKSANPGPKDVVPGSGLPKTGAPILGLSLLALALTIAGMGTLTARRRQS